MKPRETSDVAQDTFEHNMERKELIESNKLIAAFIGVDLDFSIDLFKDSKSPLRHIINNREKSNGLLFHESWDWLMPVVEKIERTKIQGREAFANEITDVEYEFSVEIKNNQCMIHRDISPQYHGTLTDFLELYDCRNTSKMKSVFVACCEFIKYYNNNKAA